MVEEITFYNGSSQPLNNLNNHCQTYYFNANQNPTASHANIYETDLPLLPPPAWRDDDAVGTGS